MFVQITQTVETVVLANLDTAYRLARWHFRNKREAVAVVQEASQRAFRGLPTFSAETDRAWFLGMVSRVCAERRERGEHAVFGPLDGEQPEHILAGSNAEDRLNRAKDLTELEEAIRSLPAHLREVLVLRDLEGLSYRELADLMGVSIETVTVSLSRSRQALGRALTGLLVACPSH
jgi:RNA polymerase sigma-70 factor (ECF subfamily)